MNTSVFNYTNYGKLLEDFPDYQVYQAFFSEIEVVSEASSNKQGKVIVVNEREQSMNQTGYEPSVIDIDVIELAKIDTPPRYAFASDDTDPYFENMLCNSVPFRAFWYRHCKLTTLEATDIIGLVSYAKVIKSYPIDIDLLNKLVTILDDSKLNIPPRAKAFIKSTIDELFTLFVLYKSLGCRSIILDGIMVSILSKFTNEHTAIIVLIKRLIAEAGGSDDVRDNIVTSIGMLLRSALVSKFEVKTEVRNKQFQYKELCDDGDTITVREEHPITSMCTRYLALAVAADLVINEFNGELSVLNEVDQYSLSDNNLNDALKTMFNLAECSDKFFIMVVTKSNQQFIVYDSWKALGYYRAAHLTNSYL